MEEKQNKSVTSVEVIDSGPLKIAGNFILCDLKKGENTSPGEILLCRCGKSSDKPYCDGSHKK